MIGFLLALAASLPALSQGCKKCSDKGFVECRKHTKAELALEENALFCSRLLRCDACGGAKRIACDNCSAQSAVEEGIAKERARLAEWLAKRAEIDAYIERPILHLESAHFRMVWEIPEVQVGRKRYDQHESAHLYLGRMEEFRVKFRETFGAEEKDFQNKCDLFCWTDRREHQMAALKYAGGSAAGGMKLLGYLPVYSFFRDRNVLIGDDDIHRHLVHVVAHLLLSNAWGGVWIGNIKGGWADEGTSYYFEDLLFGQCTTFCFEEVNTNVTFRGGKWRPPVRDAVMKERFTPFAELSRKNGSNLTTPEMAQSWSHAEFLIGMDGPKFAAIVRLLKQKKSAAEALREVYGWTIVEFEEAWKKHVRDTYPPR